MQLGALARRILKWLRLLIYVPYSLWPTARIQQLTHLPFSIPEAFELLVLNKKTSNRMLKEYYSDKLIYVAGMSKSASHLVEQCIVEILAKSDGKNPAPTYMNGTYGRKWLRHILTVGSYVRMQGLPSRTCLS